MTILVAAEGADAVVKMEAADPLAAEHLVDLRHHRLVAGLVGQIVAGGKGMTGVETDADAAIIVNTVDDLTQFAKITPDGGALARHQLEQCDRIDTLRCFDVDAVERGRDPFDTGLGTTLDMGTGVEYDVGDLVGVCAL